MGPQLLRSMLYSWLSGHVKDCRLDLIRLCLGSAWGPDGLLQKGLGLLVWVIALWDVKAKTAACTTRVAEIHAAVCQETVDGKCLWLGLQSAGFNYGTQPYGIRHTPLSNPPQDLYSEEGFWFWLDVPVWSSLERKVHTLIPMPYASLSKSCDSTSWPC